jgi:periplasmic copper chaperone A
MAFPLRLSLALAALTVSAAGFAQSAKLGAIEVSDAWSRETPPTAAVGGGFMVLKNTGKTDDALIAIKADVSKTVELHTHIMEGGVARMRAVPKIPVAAGGSTELKPGSFHVMFIDLKAPLKPGTKIPATLVFEKAGEVKVDFVVEAFGARRAAPAHKH